MLSNTFGIPTACATPYARRCFIHCRLPCKLKIIPLRHSASSYIHTRSSARCLNKCFLVQHSFYHFRAVVKSCRILLGPPQEQLSGYDSCFSFRLSQKKPIRDKNPFHHEYNPELLGNHMACLMIKTGFHICFSQGKP